MTGMLRLMSTPNDLPTGTDAIDAECMKIVRTESMLLSGAFPEQVTFRLVISGNFTVNGNSYQELTVYLPRITKTFAHHYHIPCYVLCDAINTENGNPYGHTPGFLVDYATWITEPITGNVSSLKLYPPSGFRFTKLAISGFENHFFFLIDGGNNYSYVASKLNISMSNDGEYITTSINTFLGGQRIGFVPCFNGVPGGVLLEMKSMDASTQDWLRLPLAEVSDIKKDGDALPESISVYMNISGHYCDDTSNTINNTQEIQFFRVKGTGTYVYQPLSRSEHPGSDPNLTGMVISEEYFSYTSGSDRPANITVTITLSEPDYQLVNLESSLNVLKLARRTSGSSSFISDAVYMLGKNSNYTIQIQNCVELKLLSISNSYYPQMGIECA